MLPRHTSLPLTVGPHSAAGCEISTAGQGQHKWLGQKIKGQIRARKSEKLYFRPLHRHGLGPWAQRRSHAGHAWGIGKPLPFTGVFRIIPSLDSCSQRLVVGQAPV